MTAPRRGFDVPYGQITRENGEATQAMAEYMDALSAALAKLKTAADAMDDLEPGSTTLDEMVTAWEEFRAALQEIE